MSPILLRPIREQVEHDRVIRQLEERWRKYEVGVNLGDRLSVPVKLGDRELFPDVVLVDTSGSRRLHGVAEVETAESVNHLEAMAEWAHFARVRGAFYLYVPAGFADVAQRICEQAGIKVTEIWAYYAIGAEVKFSLSYRSPQARRAAAKRAAARAAAATAKKTAKKAAAKKKAPAGTAAVKKAVAKKSPTKKAAGKKAAPKKAAAKKSGCEESCREESGGQEVGPTEDSEAIGGEEGRGRRLSASLARRTSRSRPPPRRRSGRRPAVPAPGKTAKTAKTAKTVKTAAAKKASRTGGKPVKKVARAVVKTAAKTAARKAMPKAARRATKTIKKAAKKTAKRSRQK